MDILKKLQEMLKKIKLGPVTDSFKAFVADIKAVDPKLLHPKNIVNAVKEGKFDPLLIIKRNFIWIAVGVLILAFLMTKTVGVVKTVIFGPKEKGKEAVEFVETIPVKAYKVKLMDFKDTLPAMGRIEGFREIELRFDAKGNIESFNFEEGEKILEGDIIATLDQKDALLKLKYANLELEKTKKMYELGGVAKMALEQKQLEYESAKRDLERTNIYAPSDGYLGSREKNPGTFVMSQDKIGIFVDFSQVYATFDVIEEDSPKIEIGQKAEIYLDAYPGESYSGTVDMLAPMIEGRTRTQKVKIELDNEDGKLKPGMFARAIINTYEKKEALIIPASAFKKKENQFFVYVVHTESEGEAAEGGKAPDKEKVADKGKAPKEAKPQREDELPEGEQGASAEGEGAPAGEESAGMLEEGQSMMGTVEEREIGIEYLTHDMAEVNKGLKEGELVIRELHQEFKDKDKVEVTEVQESIF